MTAETLPENDPESELQGTRMSFGEHLEELRSRIIKALIGSIIGLIITLTRHREVMELVVRPFRQVMASLHRDDSLKVTGPAQGFFSYIKVSFLVGLILTAPIWTYQIWAFIGAGLYKTERRVAYRYAPLCFVLFAAGVVFGYFVLIPIGLRYLVSFPDPAVIQEWISLQEYLRFFTLLTLVLGLAFQLPMIMIGMSRLGVSSPAAFRNKRRYVILLIFVLAALLTPPDPVTQCLLAVPLVGLYELGILCSWLLMGRDRPPLDRKLLWKRLRYFLIIALVLVLFRNVLVGMWERSQADDRLYLEREEGRPDFKAAIEELVGGPAEDFFWADESEEEDRLMAFRAQGRFGIARIADRRLKSTVLDRVPRSSEGARLRVSHAETGHAVVDVILPTGIRYSEFLPTLLKSLRFGDDDVAAVVRRLLEVLTGEQPKGDSEAACDAFESWYRRRERDEFQQSPGSIAADAGTFAGLFEAVGWKVEAVVPISTKGGEHRVAFFEGETLRVARVVDQTTVSVRLPDQRGALWVLRPEGQSAITRIDLPDVVPFTELVPPLIVIGEKGDIPVALAARRLLLKLAGLSVEGTPKDQMARVKAWYEGHATETLRQR